MLGTIFVQTTMQNCMCLILEAEVYGPKTDYFGKMKVTQKEQKKC